MLPSEELFKLGCDLIKKEIDSKLTPESADFLTKNILYNPMIAEYTDVFSPATNNAVESTNAKLKLYITMYRKMNILEFITAFSGYMLSVPVKSFASRPSYNSTDTNMGEWVKVGKHTEQNTNYYAYTKNNGPQSAKEIAQRMLTKNFWTLLELLEFFREYSIVTCKKKLECYKDITCSCWSFTKHNVCSHVFDVLVNLKMTAIVDMTLTTNKENKYGRRKNIRRNNALNKED